MKTNLLLLCVVFTVVATEKYTVEHPSSDLIAEAERIDMERGSRIIGGSDTTISDFPWQASLRSSGSHICGAAIIGSRWLVSAAHCTQNAPSSYTVMVGSSSRFSTDNVYHVINVFNHENYNEGSGSFPNDISVLELSIDLDTSNPNIQPINLPTSDPDAGSHCTITGWGRTSTSNNVLPATLQAVSKPVISNNDCFWDMFLTGTIIDSHICVYTDGVESACNGDSGGPMSCPTADGGVMLAGVTSWGRSNCPEGYPSVYTRISHFVEWINSKMN